MFFFFPPWVAGWIRNSWWTPAHQALCQDTTQHGEGPNRLRVPRKKAQWLKPNKSRVKTVKPSFNESFLWQHVEDASLFCQNDRWIFRKNLAGHARFIFNFERFTLTIQHLWHPRGQPGGLLGENLIPDCHDNQEVFVWNGVVSFRDHFELIFFLPDLVDVNDRVRQRLLSGNHVRSAQ